MSSNHYDVLTVGGGLGGAAIAFQKGTDVNRFTGANDIDRFKETSIKIGAAKEWYASARPNGPLATFDATDDWVEHPYRDGVALVGDAAATSDPTWGQGMSVTLRDVRLLRDELCANEDWNAAGHAYAAKHDAFHREVHTADGWFTDLFCDVGTGADELRTRAFPQILADPTRVLTTPIAGPEVVADPAARRRFFAEDAA